jgi:hypothetical protein
LINLANNILPTCTDAEKTLKLLELWVFICFFIVHCLILFLTHVVHL